ncbi:MAG: helix-turn-helix domain-containing protein [Myxococcales bacterium]|nr:helix-turn-helix domain-containing protein [Myxococcales bacterium]
MHARASAELSRVIERTSWLSALGHERRVDRLPDGRTALVVRVLGAERGEVHVLGPRTQATLKRATFERALLVQFKPGCSASLLGVPARELTDRYVPLEDLWGRAAATLASDLVRAPDAGTALVHLQRAFTARRGSRWRPTSAGLARHAAYLLEHEDSRVEGVARRLGVTSRHLRRTFDQCIGVAPKSFARAARLQRAVRMLNRSNDWGSIALEAGYYDQPHLIAEFRSLVGLTPGAFAERVRR